jgi:nitroreductase
MEVFDAVRTVLAVRSFSDRPVAPEIVRKVADAAHLTASSRNGQPWHFTVVDDRATLRELGRIATTGPYTADAAFAVVVAIEDSPYGVSDGSRAIQSMVLTAWSEGVGSNWVGFRNLPGLNAVLGIPEELEVIGIIPFGYPARKLGRGKKTRKPFAEVVGYGRFGQPFAPSP